MTEWFTDAGRHLVDWMFAMTVWTALLFAAARTLDRAVSRRVAPGWRMFLYAPVLVRLVLPLDASTPVGIGAVVTGVSHVAAGPVATGGIVARECRRLGCGICLAAAPPGDLRVRCRCVGV